jgi:hypothetical protein
MHRADPVDQVGSGISGAMIQESHNPPLAINLIYIHLVGNIIINKFFVKRFSQGKLSSIYSGSKRHENYGQKVANRFWLFKSSTRKEESNVEADENEHNEGGEILTEFELLKAFLNV